MFGEDAGRKERKVEENQITLKPPAGSSIVWYLTIFISLLHMRNHHIFSNTFCYLLFITGF
jgi:hypothetical protein